MQRDDALAHSQPQPGSTGVALTLFEEGKHSLRDGVVVTAPLVADFDEQKIRGILLLPAQF